MALSPTRSSCASLQTLPLELLLEISKYFLDFPSLNGLFTLLTAHDQGVSFIQNFQSTIFANVIRFDREDQITRIIIAVMSLRNDTTIGHPFSKDGLDELDFVWKYLLSPDSKSARKPHYLPWFSDPIATVRDICQISEDIEKLIQVFLNACIIKPSGQEDALSVSSTELYRTRRAFWRFQLCYDMCHADDLVPYGFESQHASPLAGLFPCYWSRQIYVLGFLDTTRLEPTNPILPDFLTFLLRNTSGQEVEELDTVHDYLALLINKLQSGGGHKNSSRLRSEPALLQRLINDFSHRQDEEADEKVDPIAFMRNEIRYGGARFALYRDNRRRPGFQALNEAIISNGPSISDKNWGWRIWDQDRLAMSSLSSLTGFNGIEFRKILRECEEAPEAQSTYLDYWVGGINCDNVKLEEGIPLCSNKRKGEGE